MLHRYVAVRVLAKDKGYEFGVARPEIFKGTSFMELDMGVKPAGIKEHFEEKKVIENGVDIRSYDPEINFVEDFTSLDGEFQDPRYFEHRLDDIREWLKVEPLNMPDNVCVINFRGGEYALYPDLFLTHDYWSDAIEIIQKECPEAVFEVHTDDEVLAKQFFPTFKIIHDIGINWRSIRYAKYLILANSSFAILPALLNQDAKLIVAPRYWARRNTGVWALPQNYYKQFTYI